MFDSQGQDTTQRQLKAIPLTHLAREGKLGLDTPRSYLVPLLLWVTAGHGRIGTDDAVRGFTTHNAIYVPANTPLACEIGPRVLGTAVFFGSRAALPCPQETLHLRLKAIQHQTEFNQLIENLRRDSENSGPYASEILHHRAALALLWLSQMALSTNVLSTIPAVSNIPAQRATGG